MATNDVLSLLKKDHETVRTLLEDLEASEDKDEQAMILTDIKKEILVHAKVEEEIFYPAMRREAADREDRVLVIEAKEEHSIVEKVIADLENEEPGSESFEAKVHVLKEMIEHHAKEEEEEMFPKARKVLKAHRLQELAEEIEARKVELDDMLEKELESL